MYEHPMSMRSTMPPIINIGGLLAEKSADCIPETRLELPS
jgi:hypothetical protein